MIGIRSVISVTRDDSRSTSRRNSSLLVRSRSRNRITSRAAAGTTTRNTGRNAGVFTPMMIRPPSRLLIAARPTSAACCTACSTVSTSRITLACSTPELTLAW